MINFTDSAVKKVAEMTAESTPGKLLRIFVEPGGCSGFEYGMSIDEPKSTDRIGDFSGIGYAVDGDSLEYLSGCEIHFDDGLSGKGFEIRNPNAESTCGCGKSFN
ncbi:MAG: iron-sulfur cluster assembly accessory protein [Opitutae bacterium]|nr:iron-sulfur cluster assembly accessory protein [Opitutae bacterium]